MIYGVIYLLWNTLNGKRYVGQTTKPLDVRIMQHKRSDFVVDKAIQKYGIENFRYGVIKTCATREELNYWEKYFIVTLNSKAPYGYNMTDGGEGNAGWHHKPESIAKMSKKHRGKKLTSKHCAENRRAYLVPTKFFAGIERADTRVC